ncbi:MAG: SH3 domain-containing protein [Hyphomicrobiales bacterium]|nr:SH3 domain-containing protein [Hyphomicrobiales bacterium]
MPRAVLFLSLWLLSGIAYADDIVVKPVHFPAGQSGTTLQGTVKGYETIDYVLGASAGQRMKIDFQTSNASSYFNLLPGNDETAIFVGSTSGNHFDGALPATGDYRIRVYLMRNAARRNETARYKLSVAIRGATAQSAPSHNPDYADGLSGGPDYWEVFGTPDTLNIRSAPSASSQILVAFPPGTVLQNLGCRMTAGQRWCKVAKPGANGVTGWAAGRFLREAAAPPSTNPGADGTTTDSASAVDKNACLAAVSKQTNNSVVVLSSEFSEANTSVIIGVGPDRAPWQCLVSRGRVAEVMSLTDEGAL